MYQTSGDFLVITSRGATLAPATNIVYLGSFPVQPIIPWLHFQTDLKLSQHEYY